MPEAVKRSLHNSRLSHSSDDGLRNEIGLLAMPLGEVTPLHLSREWNRLLKSGGHHRKTKQARPLSAKTVRHIAGLVSSAFARAERWGLVPGLRNVSMALAARV